MSERQYDIGFFSSPDRGLECLLDLIPKIEDKLGRKVKTVWAYGWNNYDVAHAKSPEKMKWKWQMIRKMNAVGMENKGRLSHEDLAKLMKDVKVWAYPTEFTEIHAITALKTTEAGMSQVHTGVAALKETAPNATIVDCDDIYTNEAKQDEFVAAVVTAIKSGKPVKQVESAYWSDVAQVWSEAMA